MQLVLGPFGSDCSALFTVSFNFFLIQIYSVCHNVDIFSVYASQLTDAPHCIKILLKELVSVILRKSVKDQVFLCLV